jgi:hypothetical protein
MAALKMRFADVSEGLTARVVTEEDAPRAPSKQLAPPCPAVALPAPAAQLAGHSALRRCRPPVAPPLPGG